MAGNGQRESNGHFAKGWDGGPGRPRGLDFRKCAEEWAQSKGKTLDAAALDVVDAIFTAARAGDMSAAKLLVDRLFGPLAQKLEHAGELTLRELLRAASDAANGPPPDAT